MTAFTQVPALPLAAPLATISSSDWNNDFAALRNVLNGLVSGANTIAVDTITENTAAHGVIVNKAFAVSAGLSTFTSGITVTGTATFAGTVAVNVGMAVSGIATFSSGVAISGGVVSGSATFSSGFAISGGVVSGSVPFTSGFAISAGAVSATGIAADFGSVHALAIQNITANQNLPLLTASNIGVVVATNGKISHNGVLGVVCANATLATAATNGFLYIPTMSATASGTPAVETGTVPLAYEVGGNHLMVFSGGVWKQVALA